MVDRQKNGPARSHAKVLGFSISDSPAGCRQPVKSAQWVSSISKRIAGCCYIENGETYHTNTRWPVRRSTCSQEGLGR